MAFFEPRRLVFILATALHLTTCCAQSSKPIAGDAGAKPSAEELLSKEIAPGQRVRVIREPRHATQLGELGKSIAAQGADIASIRVELSTAVDPAILVGSAIESDFPDFRNRFDVINVFTGRGEMVVVCTISDVVGLWRISLDLHQQLPDGWTWVGSPVRYAAIIPFGRDTVSVVMSPVDTAPEKQQWRLIIIDKRPPDPITTVYEQVADAWRFAPSKPGAAELGHATTQPSPR